jgi:DNA-binding transcriptional LysR family regulator
MSQPALSQAIRDLEAGLGARLFDRTTRRVDLTEAGRAFAAAALPGLDEIDRAVAAVRDLTGLHRGLVRIAAPPLLAATLVPRALSEVARRHPGLDLRLEDVATDAIVARLASGRVELGLATFPPGLDDLALVPVLRDGLSAVLRSDHPLAGQAAVRWTDLADQPVIALARESGLRLLTEIGFERAGVAFRPVHEVQQIFTALALVAELGGVAVLPDYARAAFQGRPLAAVPLVEPAVERTLALGRARSRPASAATLAVAAILQQGLRARP